MWYAYVIGYGFAVIIGHFLIKLVADRMWKALGWKGPEDTIFRPDVWQPQVIGVVERTLYTASLQIGIGEFIGFWLAVKVAGQWNRWGEEKEYEGRPLHGRSIYQNFLIGNGLSILYSAVGFKLIEWLTNRNWLLAVSTPAALVAATIGLWFWIGQYRRAGA